MTLEIEAMWAKKNSRLIHYDPRCERVTGELLVLSPR